jgi:DNA-binding CsgD family transcriptional regulator
VDRISINVDRLYTVHHGALRSSVASTVHVHDNSTRELALSVKDFDRDARYFVELFRGALLPVADYHPPRCLSYYSSEGNYLGSIVLWSLRSGPMVPVSTVEKLELLRPFLTFAFSDAVARYQDAHQFYSSALKALSRFGRIAGLSRRELEVLLSRFNGKTIAETSSLLNISEATVRRHVRSIGAKLETYDEMQRKLLVIPIRSRR